MLYIATCVHVIMPQPSNVIFSNVHGMCTYVHMQLLVRKCFNQS